MADQKELAIWIAEHAKHFQLKVKHLSWPTEFGLSIQDVSVQVTVNQRVFVGRGADEDVDIALIKATVEAFERAICYANKISTIGVAGHIALAKAQENALLEFIERTSLQNHFSKKQPMQKLSTHEQIVQTKDFGKVVFRLHHFQMQTPKGIYSVFALAEAFDHKLGGIMGLAAERSLDQAIKKSTIEVLRNLTSLQERSINPLSLAEFKKISYPTAEDSQRLLFDHQYTLNLYKTYSQEDIFVPAENHPINVQFKNLECSFSELNSIPLYFVQATDHQGQSTLQPEFVG
ncbi:MAG: hypothetical protein ACOYOK_01780 [Pseudobdellovibrionaceae bacterium]